MLKVKINFVVPENPTRKVYPLNHEAEILPWIMSVNISAIVIIVLCKLTERKRARLNCKLKDIFIPPAMKYALYLEVYCNSNNIWRNTNINYNVSWLIAVSFLLSLYNKDGRWMYFLPH